LSAPSAGLLVEWLLALCGFYEMGCPKDSSTNVRRLGPWRVSPAQSRCACELSEGGWNSFLSPCTKARARPVVEAPNLPQDCNMSFLSDVNAVKVAHRPNLQSQMISLLFVSPQGHSFFSGKHPPKGGVGAPSAGVFQMIKIARQIIRTALDRLFRAEEDAAEQGAMRQIGPLSLASTAFCGRRSTISRSDPNLCETEIPAKNFGPAESVATSSSWMSSAIPHSTP
jgi:hypothetical protein